MTFPLSRTIPSLAAAILPWAASAQDVDCTAEERREYRLTGWAFAIPFEPGSEPPRIDCVAPAEWFVHEAGWHTMDGGMQLTPDARGEPPRSHARSEIYFWHPRVWDAHFWRGEDGVPTVVFDNPRDAGHGLQLPRDAFFRLRDGRKVPAAPPQDR